MTLSKYVQKTFSRRDFVKSCAAATLGANIIGCSQRKEKPNLLFIWTDEQRADTMSAYGNHKIHAPSLNKLASESIVFQNAYVSQPVCTPSRSTVMTGLWPHMNTCRENNIPLPAETPCFTEILNDPEYRTGYFGKWHLGDEIFAQHGFEEWEAIEDGYRRYYRPDKDRNKCSSYHHFLTGLGYEPDTRGKTFSRGFAVRLPLEHCKPKFLEQKACDFLSRHRNEPFALYVNFLEPHMPFYGPLDNEHSMEDVGLPANFDDPLEENEPLRYRYLRDRYRERGFEGHDLKTKEGWTRLRTNYWGLVTQVDLSVGAILNKLEELGLADNTIVVYTSDHGDMMGAHQLLAKTVMYEESVKVPWLMRIPQLGRKQQIVSDRVSHIDLVPTLLDAMNAKTNISLPGQTLMPLLQNQTVNEDHIFIEWNPNIVNGRRLEGISSMSDEEAERIRLAYIRTVISPDGWKLCLCDNDKSQLFNLNKDPYETSNLFYTGQHQDIINRLSKKIATWQEQVKDTNVNVV